MKQPLAATGLLLLRVEDDCFGHPLFTVTDHQRPSSVEVLEATRPAEPLDIDKHQNEVAAAHGVTIEEEEDDDDDDDVDGETSDEEIRSSRRAQRRQAQASQREFAVQEDQQHLDQITLTFCLSWIQHRLEDSSFENAMLSFCAVLAWTSSRAAWRKDTGNYSSSLTQLIYVCQWFILFHCDKLGGVSQRRELQFQAKHKCKITSRTTKVSNPF